MFSALKDLSIKEPVQPKKAELARGMSLRSFRAAHRQIGVTARIANSIAKTNSVVLDFTHLRRLKAVAATEGLNKALTSFVNPNNNVISRVTKNFPSNESLDLVSIGKSDRRTKAAIEGISESLNDEPKLISDWTHSSADDVAELLSSIEDQLEDTGQAISYFLEALQDGNATDEGSASVVETVPYTSSMARFDALLEIIPDMDALVSDPTDRDAMEIYKQKIISLIEKIGPIAGLGIDPENQYLIVAAPTSDDYMVRSAALSDLGYTPENVVELLKKADQLVDEVNGLVQRKEQIVSHLHTAADLISEIDNTVSPAVEGAIEENDGVSRMGDGLTQADVYHSQVSSHLYCLSVIASVAMSAVQEVLVAASELSNSENDIVVVAEVTE